MESIQNPRFVLITGASTGIGRATTEILSKKGFSIYACARKEKDLNSLSKLENVIPIKLDVTQDQEIDDALSLIKERKKGLYAIINNAGVDVLGPMVDFDVKAFKWQLDVNLIGVHRIITKFFPLILESNGRIINISSGLALSSVPFSGLYCASKAGLEAYTDSLRREIMLINKKIKVIIIQPGIVKTPIWKKHYPMDIESSIFRDSYFKWQKINKSPYDPKKKSLSPQDVGKKIYKALSRKRPKIRYLVTEKNFIYRIMIAAPEILKDIALRSVIQRQNLE